MKGTGIYSISIGARFYFGSASISFQRRMTEHLSKLRNGKHNNAIMQAAFNKYGESNFLFAIVERCEAEKCLDREQEYLDEHFENNLCMNLSPTAESTRGFKFSDESKKKISAANARRKVTEHTRKMLSERMKSFKHTAESKLKIAESNRRRKVSDETRLKMGQKNKGRRMSDENRKKMSLLHKGRKKSPETRARMVIAQRKRASESMGAIRKCASQKLFSFESESE